MILNYRNTLVFTGLFSSLRGKVTARNLSEMMKTLGIKQIVSMDTGYKACCEV